MMKRHDDVFVYEWTDSFENNCNSFFVGGDVGVLIDPGLLAYVPRLLDRMARDGISLADIRYVINTHSHPDHFEGSEYFYGKNIPVGLHGDEAAFLSGAGGELYGLFGLETPEPTIDLVLAEGGIDLGGETFQVLHVPGHSPGSVALYSPGRKILFAGDVIFDQSIGRTDFPGGDGKLLKSSIKKLSALNVESVFPGHMGIIDGAANVKRNFQIIIKYFFPNL